MPRAVCRPGLGNDNDKEGITLRNDRHLNIFEHYMQQGAIAHENNISRGLAILLKDDSLLFDRFIDLLNRKLVAKGSPPFSKPMTRDDWEVGFQQRTSELAGYDAPKRIVGVTLPPQKAEVNISGSSLNTDGDPITDIAIMCGDDLIVVEVKTQNVPAGDQVAKQIQSIHDKQDDKQNSAITPQILATTWAEVIDVLRNVHNLKRENETSVLAHYPGAFGAPLSGLAPRRSFSSGTIASGDTTTDQPGHSKTHSTSCGKLLSAS
jgi:hypothetical protein